MEIKNVYEELQNHQTTNDHSLIKAYQYILSLYWPKVLLACRNAGQGHEGKTASGGGGRRKIV
jgi:hypothetical protein